MTDKTYHHLREDYQRHALLESEVDADPFRQFEAWFQQAIDTGRPDPNAMTLATCGADLRPSSRVVLLKAFSPAGFDFYTNYVSRKGEQIASNPQVALSFYWPELERQVRIEGRAEKVSAAESDAYFASRPAGSRLGAHASQQSSVIPDRAHLENELERLKAQYGDDEIPRPAHWGGYRVVPDRIEFWQGRPSRLHDRLVYRLENSKWLLERLAP